MSSAGRPDWATLRREDFYDDTARGSSGDKLTAEPDHDPYGTPLLPGADESE